VGTARRVSELRGGGRWEGGGGGGWGCESASNARHEPARFACRSKKQTQKEGERAMPFRTSTSYLSLSSTFTAVPTRETAWCSQQGLELDNLLPRRRACCYPPYSCLRPIMSSRILPVSLAASALC
jgi:hypothetical protein